MISTIPINLRPWPVVLIRDQLMAYGHSREFLESSLRRRHSKLGDGLCFSSSARWCRYFLENPNESPNDRIKHLASCTESLAATQFLLHEMNMEKNASFVNFSNDSEYYNSCYAEYFNAACRVSRINFEYDFHDISYRDVYSVSGSFSLSSTMKIINYIVSGNTYLLYITGYRNPSFGKRSRLGNPSPVPYSHIIALAKSDDSSAKVFDSNFGEILVDKFQLGCCLFDLWKHYEDERGYPSRGVVGFKCKRA